MASWTVRPGNAQTQGRRSQQQDAFGFGRFDDPAWIAHGGHLAVLADGMGGMENGRRAALDAVRAFLAAYGAKTPAESVPAALLRALEAANREVHALAEAGQGEGRTGTTLVAAVLHGRQLHWISVGDSHVYHFDRERRRLSRLNPVHLHAEVLDREVAAGRLTAEAAARHPDREALTSFLGLDPIPTVARSETARILASGDRVMLASDGVYRRLAVSVLCRALRRPPQLAAEWLIRRIDTRAVPGQDNATVAILGLEAENPPWRARRRFLVAAALTAVLSLAYWEYPGERELRRWVHRASGFWPAPVVSASDPSATSRDAKQPVSSGTAPAPQRREATP